MITSKDDKWIIKIVEALVSPIVFSGEHRQEHWEYGWQQNVNEKSVVPHYFGKYPVIRRDGKFYDAIPGEEYQQLVDLETDVFSKYLKDASHIYEFGCGTGHNLLTIRSVNQGASITGLDWVDSSMKSVKRLGFPARKFDMFHPDYSFNISGGAVVTVAALEQLGENYDDFLKYLLEQKPSICVHLEPIIELMDPTNLLDYLQIQYMKKRNYLQGFATHLLMLENEGKVQIETLARNGVGSLFIEGYSLLVWKPLL